jgi:RHS repeat-associated protein
VENKYYFYIQDHLGNNRVVTDQRSTIIQSTQYYPFGMAMGISTGQAKQPYKFGGKELDMSFGVNQYDFVARGYDPNKGFMSIDPLCEQYYWISPYAQMGLNPLRYVDPDGKDVWEINGNGSIIQRIEDKTQDAFYMVQKDGDGNYPRTYTTDEDGNKNYNSIAFEYGTVTSVQEQNIKLDVGGEAKLTMFGIKGDDKATQLFEFMANPSATTNVEWSHNKIGAAESENNIVGTMHHESLTAQGYYLMKKGYTIREDNHSHPQGYGPNNVDARIARDILYSNPNAKFNVYTGTGQYSPYDNLGRIYPGRLTLPTIKKSIKK